MIEGLIGGLLAGIAYGLVGYFKNHDENYEEFDWNYFIPTVAGSAFFGAVAQYSGLGIDVVASSAIGVVVTQVARKGWNILLEKIGSW